jgi:uncharacterized peroxidase-related enzyme
MVRLNPIEAGQIGNEMQEILDSTHVPFEEVPNFLKVLGNSTAGLKAYVESEEALVNGELSPRFRELIALTVAEINACGYSLAFHSAAARELGLTEEDIQLARRAAALDPKANAMLRFAQRIVVQRGRITDADYRALCQAGFSRSQIVEVIANIALNTFTNFLNLAAMTEADFPSVESACQTPGEGMAMPAGCDSPPPAAPRVLKMALPNKAVELAGASRGGPS